MKRVDVVFALPFCWRFCSANKSGLSASQQAVFSEPTRPHPAILVLFPRCFAVKGVGSRKRPQAVDPGESQGTLRCKLKLGPQLEETQRQTM